MSLFNLPKSTIVDRIIPKNAFDTHINHKQKKLFTEIIEKIKWTNKISRDTINLEGTEISEIQLFEIQVRSKENLQDILEIMDKSIPYHIIFVIFFENQFLLSTSKKHINPTNEDRAIIDWTFTTVWFDEKSNIYQFNLSQNIDFIYTDFCSQIASIALENQPIGVLITQERDQNKLQRKIHQLENAINKEKQFNKKISLNLELQKLKNKD
jgi:uncharacterized protein (UPF0248 family)